ncbi:S-layer homology domain-containing protein [Paenibacillus lentus]|uniref:S-layer homology domain-containing protein n=1 Tax=Paenibacillus lentus TaxID=1338368 RepID=A0A3Q8SAN6_9BACL|nr:S-layer homology domain-containing protein [Paenibacillus lentus]AZK46217.1 S-layer homology domain-containing protein [Paenibacillus lentus]
MTIRTMTKLSLITVLLISLIGTALPSKLHAAEPLSFTDVKQGAWYEKTVQWAIAHEMVKGYNDGTFRPQQTVSEAEFLAMLLRAFEPKLLFSAKQDHWADAYYTRADQLNYPVTGYKDLPSRNQPISREQVAELITAAEGVNFSGDHAIHYVLAFGLATGKDPNVASVDSFDGNSALTRAEALQFIKNVSENGIGGLLERPLEKNDPQDLPEL